VTHIADCWRFQEFDPACKGGITMNAVKPARSSDRIERVARGMLAAALLAAVAWALMSGSSTAPDFQLVHLWG
jgi:hypothetical protein